MQKNVWRKIATSALAMTLTFGNLSIADASIIGNADIVTENVTLTEESTLYSDLQWNVEGTNYTQNDEGITCNSIGNGDSFLLSQTVGKDFVYEADVKFNERHGAASLVFRSNGVLDSTKEMYVANINGENGEVKLFKFEDGADTNLYEIKKIDLAEDDTYHLKVVAIGKHIVYYVNNQLIINTADYTMGSLGGQNDALFEGQFGLLTWEGNVTYQNMKVTPISEDNTPQLSSLSVESIGGEVDKEILFDKDQYVYITYVTNATTAVKLLPTTENSSEITAYNEAGEVVDMNNLPVTEELNTYTLNVENGDAQVVYRVRVHKMQPDAEYYNEDYRGQYHYSVKDGWANDPNGMVYYKGQYHLFHQYYDDEVWGPMHWIHATSTDLIHWEENTIVFYPDEYGTMFSGCAVIADHTTAPDIFAEGEEGIVFLITADGGRGQKLIAAYSKDGETFQKYEEGKVLIDWSEDVLQNGAFRDPKVFRYENKWFMVIAGGPLRIYSSDNLVDWNLESAYGDLHTECPDLYPLPVTDENGNKTGEYKWVLDRGGRYYKIGDFKQVDGKWTFVPDEQYASENANGMGNEGNDGIMNFGPDSYAAMTYYMGDFGTEDEIKEQELIAINWMNTWDQGFCNAIPSANGNTVFNGTFNLQCKLGICKDNDGKLYLTQTPITEYETLRNTDEMVSLENVSITADNNPLQEFDGDSYEIVANIRPGEGVTETGFKVRTGEEEESIIKYDTVNEKLTIDRRKSGVLVTTSDDKNRFSQTVTKNADGSIDLHIYVDRSSVEVFSKDNTVAGAMQIFPEISSRGLEVYSIGGESKADIEVYPLDTIWENKMAPQTAIRLNKSSYEGYVGETFNLKTIVTPLGTDAEIIYTVDGDAVELVQDGANAVVTAVKTGKAVITASVKGQPELAKTCNVQIYENNFKTNLTNFVEKAGNWHIDGETYFANHNDNAFIFADKVTTDKLKYEVDATFSSGILNFIFQSQTQNAYEGCYSVQLVDNKVRLFDFKNDYTFEEVNTLKRAEDNKYHVEITVDGTLIEVYVNGEKYISREITEADRQYTEGYVALGLYNTSAEYQNFYVTTDSAVTKILTEIDDLYPEADSSLEEMQKLLPDEVIVAGDDFVKKDPAKITWDWSQVNPEKSGVYEVVGTVDQATITVLVTVRATSSSMGISYRTHVQNEGWQEFVADGTMSGTKGKSLRLEAIEIRLDNNTVGGSVAYRTHVQNEGWQDYVTDGAMSGTKGRSLRLEAIQIRLMGEIAQKYDIYYRTHIQDKGWLGWAVNDGKSGSAGLSKRLEAIEIRLVEKGGAAPGSTENTYLTNKKEANPTISYRTHVQNKGWQGYVAGGVTSGSTGKNLRLEAIKIQVNGDGLSGSVEYCTHVQNEGWQDYVADGAMSGTKGKSLRLEAIKIRLTGELAQKYSVEYRTHVQNEGWQKWVKDGAASGTTGKSLRLEAIQIRLIKK